MAGIKMLSLKYVLLTFFVDILCVYCINNDSIHFSVNRTEWEMADVYENLECKFNGTHTGTCQYIKNCPAAVEALRLKKRPEVCGFDGSEIMVCCAFNTQLREPTNGKSGISKIVCKRYEIQLCNQYPSIDGDELSLVIIGGGVRSKPREFQYMAAIGYGNVSEIEWHCGGSLISDRYVLSAAHCTHPGNSLGTARWVRLGDLNLKSNDDDARPEDFEIIQHINHPDYRPPQIYNDIALYKLDRPVHFNEYIKPICLHTSYETPSGRGVAIGWGRQGYADPVSDILMKVELTFVSSSNCSASDKRSSFQLPNGIDSKSMVCAGEEDGVKDTCQGDSGGPLSIYSNGCIPIQVGITSVGPLCGLPNSPGIYTRISHFVPWIESIVWRLDQKKK